MKFVRICSVFLLFSLQLQAAELQVVVPRSVSRVVTEISHFFDQQYPGSKISLRLENSLRAVRLLELGTPVDVVILSDEKQLQRARDKNLIVKNSDIRLASNELVVVAAATSSLEVKEPKNLLFPELKKVAFYPETSALQTKVKAYLGQVGLIQSLEGKKTEVKDSAAAMEAITKGEADWAIVYSSESSGRTGVKVVWRVPPADIPPVVIYAAVPENSAQKTLAGKFIESMQSTISQKIFENSGFTLTTVALPVQTPSAVQHKSQPQTQTQKTKKTKAEKKTKKGKGKEKKTQTQPEPKT